MPGGLKETKTRVDTPLDAAGETQGHLARLRVMPEGVKQSRGGRTRDRRCTRKLHAALLVIGAAQESSMQRLK
jgi:hypothetical protein